MPAMDVLSDSSCSLIPGTLPWGPGWYLVAANTRVEAGPFLTREAAVQAAWELDDACLGVHPAFDPGDHATDWVPYQPRYSGIRLLIGSRVRDRSAAPEPQVLQPTG